ncbi:MAG: tetratricopeptide repeat protein [Candidatus Hodarchaeales archaeon]
MEKKEMSELRQIDDLLKRGDFSTAKKMINSLLNQKHLDIDAHLSLNLLKGRLFVKQGQFEESRKVLEEIIQKSQENNNKLSEIDAIITLAEASWRTGKLKRSLTLLEQGEKLLSRLSDLSDLSKETYIQRTGDLLFQRGVTLMRRGQLDLAMETLKNSLTYRNQTGDLHRIGETLNSVGVGNFYKGHLDRAIANYKSSLKIKEELGNKQQIAITLNNIGDVLHTQGELTQAGSYYKKSLAIFEEIGNKEHIGSGLHNVGKFFHESGDSNQALSYLEKALEIAEKQGNDLTQSENYYHLINVCLDKSDIALAQKYFYHLENVLKQTDNKVIKQRYIVSQALILKSGKRIRDKLEALQLLEEVMEGEIINYELSIAAMLHSCHLLLFELKVRGREEKILSELKSIATRLREIAEDQSLHSLLAESYLFQSRLALIDLDFPRAEQFLSHALVIAENRRLKKLTNTISHELELFQSLQAEWENIFKKRPKVKDIAELSLINDLINRMIQKKVYKSKDEIQNYVIEVKQLISTWEGA